MWKNQILGGSVFLALLGIGLGLFFIWRPKKEVKTLKDVEKKAIVKNSLAAGEKDVEDITSEIESPDKPNGPVVLDDEDESDGDEDDEAALKTSYDDALRLAKKLLNGSKFSKAAEKFTDAINLAEQIPSAGKDIITLYNNRSAMFEKCGDLDKSLNDIMVVLTMDPAHLKARIRRARILEAQGSLKDSLNDFAVSLLLERSKGLPHSNFEKIDELVKVIAQQELVSVMESIAKSPIRSLPCKSHCRNFMDSFPSYHIWKKQFAQTDRDELVEAVRNSGGAFMEGENWADMTALEHMTFETIPTRFETVYTLACFDLALGAFKKGFEEIARAFAVLRSAQSTGEGEEQVSHAMYQTLIDTDPTFKIVVACIEDMQGTYLHLRADLAGARKCYENSLAITPLPRGFEPALKLASVFVEVGTTQEAISMYEAIKESVATSESDGEQRRVNTAWLGVHQVSLWIARGEDGKMREGGLQKAIDCIDEALALTSFCEEDDIVGKSCRLLALIKRVHVLIQTKAQFGMQPTSEDVEAAKEAVAEAKVLFPNHDTVRMLNVDFLATEGDLDSATDEVEALIASSDGDDAIPYVFKANTLAQRAMTHLQAAQQTGSGADAEKAKKYFQETEDLYKQAIDLDPQGMEAMVQFAQLKTMLGDMQGSLDLSVRALPLSRSRDEALEVLHIKIMTEAQMVAVGIIQAMGAQTGA